MKIRVFAMGNKPPAWVETGVQEYTKRLSGDISIEWNQFKPFNNFDSKGVPIGRDKESEKLLSSIPSGFRVVALDERGCAWSSKQLAGILTGWMRDSSRLCILIGGANGLSDECLARADQVWSLGPITLPHFLVRIILAEQIYRASSIKKGHPYHRE